MKIKPEKTSACAGVTLSRTGLVQSWYSVGLDSSRFEIPGSSPIACIVSTANNLTSGWHINNNWRRNEKHRYKQRQQEQVIRLIFNTVSKLHSYLHLYMLSYKLTCKSLKINCHQDHRKIKFKIYRPVTCKGKSDQDPNLSLVAKQ